MTAAAAPVPSSVVGRGRACCGPAHGRRWPIGPGDPPDRVDLPDRVGGVTPYRLVCSRRSGRPARDLLGDYLYVPAVAAVDGHAGQARDGLATVLRLPRPRARRRQARGW